MNRQYVETIIAADADRTFAHIEATVKMTTIAMRAARFGIASLTDGERQDFYRWYGCDMTGPQRDLVEHD